MVSDAVFLLTAHYINEQTFILVIAGQILGIVSYPMYGLSDVIGLLDHGP